MRKMKRNLGWLLLLLVVPGLLLAQTTGKISGKVMDAKTGQPLPGANIIVEGTSSGAVADLNGDFFILNVAPGTYTLRAQMMGYETVRMQNVLVSVNRTTESKIRMKETVLEGEVVVVQAEKVAMKKDQTSTVRNVSSQQIAALPVENMGAVVSMQAGVVNGHFRGGRSNEVTYLVDGMQVTEAFGGSGRNVELETEAIQDLEVITGTFNAEYGRAMSGIVNAVTKSGGQHYSGSIAEDLGNYYTNHKSIFIGLKDEDVLRNQDFKFQLSGPVLPGWKSGPTFFVNGRYQDNKNHLNGVRRFNPWDLSNFIPIDPMMWYSEHTGDSSYVPMNKSLNKSLMGKLAFDMIKNIRMSLLYTRNDDEWHGYSHIWKYNPDGRATSYRTSDLFSFEFNHMISKKFFYEVKLSYLDNFNGYYLYRNPTDSRYLHDKYLTSDGPGFYTGGQDKSHSLRWLKDTNAKLDVTWQATKNHSLKSGILYTLHDLDQQSRTIRNKYYGTDLENELYEPVVYPDSSVYSDIYKVKPKELSAYIQDKIEYDEMVINFGLRYDYFDPNTVYPSDLRNPANQLVFADSLNRKTTYPKADAKVQISPRLGLSYQLSNAALLHFSYGHFFQMPPLYALYDNHSLQVSPTDYSTTMGNPQIKAQRTVQYEIGLWQELIKGMGLEVALFYRDIYDLLSAKVITTYDQIEYGLYSNKDYGNAKGLEVKYDFVSGSFSAYANYTLQYSRGNADNPTTTFTRAGSSMDPISRLIPMSWDQRHTLNVTLGYNTMKYGTTMTAYYNSGATYTWSPLDESQLAKVNLYPNNAKMPSTYSVDMSAYYDIKLIKQLKTRITMNIYNLFDTLNEWGVNGNTGRAYTAIVRDSDLANHRSNFNTYYDRIHNPSMYATPRMIKLGMGIMF
ncbi:MAG TPA: TonB-dependent receptor [bacterium]|nr:TonB-dependent receptor [bacterium]